MKKRRAHTKDRKKSIGEQLRRAALDGAMKGVKSACESLTKGILISVLVAVGITEQVGKIISSILRNWQ